MELPAWRWPRELLIGLLLVPPFLGLLFEPDGMRHSFSHQVRSVFAIWLYVALCGAAIQATTELALDRWPRHLIGRFGLVRHEALALACIVLTTALTFRPLEIICEGLQGKSIELLTRGLLVGAGYILVGRAYASVLHQREVAAEFRRQTETLLHQARYDAIIARTQPHFLHNALATIAGVTQQDPEHATALLRDLSELYREMVKIGDAASIPVARELDTVERFLAIQRARFAPRLTSALLIAPAARDEHLPPLCLLPLVENAVLHGLSAGGTVHVAVSIEVDRHERIIATVRDNGPGPGRSQHDGNGTAIKALRERLQALYGEAATLSLEPTTDAQGTVVTLIIPTEERDLACAL